MLNKSTRYVWWGIIVIGVVGLLGFNTFKGYFKKTDSAGGEVPCIKPLLPIPPAYHIHPKLTMIVDVAQVPFPDNVGRKLSDCERVLHTHDASGEIHIEPNVYQEFTLGQFFALWGMSFSNNQLLERRADAEHEIVMTVGGVPSDQFEKLVLKDKQEIVVEYRKKEPAKDQTSN